MCEVCQGVGVIYSDKAIGIEIKKCPACEPTKSDLAILLDRIEKHKELTV